MRVVIDTNVLVSGMLSGASPPAQILQFVLQGNLTLLIDGRIAAEYDEVTARARLGFDPVERQAFLQTLYAIAEPVVASPIKARLPDPDDHMFLEVAVGGKANALIAGNVRHFPVGRLRLGIPVLTPRQFVEQVRAIP